MTVRPLSAADHAQLAELGIAPSEASRQLELLRNPPPSTKVLRPCVLGDGVAAIAAGDEPVLLERWERAAAAGRLSSLVPASGAATRLFKALVAELQRLESGDDAPGRGEPATFFAQLPHFAFYDTLAADLLRVGFVLEPDMTLTPPSRRLLLRHLLTEAGLGYADFPKGLIPFHWYPEGVRTPFEEHLVEATQISRSSAGACRLHFTVAADHEAAFRKLLEKVRPFFEQRSAAHFEVEFSTQRRATDTLAIDLDGEPVRRADGRLLLRPGGHGALLANLHALAETGADIVLLKNIDNVVPDRTKPLVARWKRLLVGLLVRLEDRVQRYAAALAGGAGAPREEIAEFLTHELGRPAAELRSDQDLVAALARPLRVCGVVRNTGEPGGGPFWVQAADGSVSAQIVETSQVDPRSAPQQAVLAASTHFSPVDIVCALRDATGAAYHLPHFVDPATVFISEKSHAGQPLRALEHPGLWNGAMAGWNTRFVEVPNETFAPVKTVIDLLRPEHQP